MPVRAFLSRFTSFKGNKQTKLSRSGSTISHSKSLKRKPSVKATAPPISSETQLPDVAQTESTENETDSPQTQQSIGDESIDTYVNAVSEVKNFWDIGKYKYTVKRCDDGHELGEELIKMISERARLDEAYAKSLNQWHKDWTVHLRTNSKEYETGKDSWQAMLNTGKESAEIYMESSKKLLNGPVAKIKEWLKKNYVKPFLQDFKVTKTLEVDKISRELS